eukprot:4600261-Pyramimonas_sp.AAC.1
MGMCSCQRLVLVGDHRQLPPTILSYKAKLEGLDESLFERFIRLGYPYTMMDIQFRMHPSIAEFPAAHWYNGALANGVTAEQRRAPAGIAWPDPSQVRSPSLLRFRLDEPLPHPSQSPPVSPQMSVCIVELLKGVSQSPPNVQGCTVYGSRDTGCTNYDSFYQNQGPGDRTRYGGISALLV